MTAPRDRARTRIVDDDDHDDLRLIGRRRDEKARRVLFREVPPAPWGRRIPSGGVHTIMDVPDFPNMEYFGSGAPLKRPLYSSIRAATSRNGSRTRRAASGLNTRVT